VHLIGLNAQLMHQHIEFVADSLLASLGNTQAYYGAENPFDFMDMMSFREKTNFIERRTSEYRKARVGDRLLSLSSSTPPRTLGDGSGRFLLDEDF